MIEFGELDDLAWLPLVLLAIVLAWRPGLATLAVSAGSGHLRAWRSTYASTPVRWPGLQFGSVLDQARGLWLRTRKSSGNQSFDNHRHDALSKLDDEQREFRAFVDQLGQARDQAEFDAFVAERRRRQLGSNAGQANMPA